MISVHFQDKPFNITIIQVYALTSNAEEAEDERFCEDLQDLLELTLKKHVLFIIGDWNAKVGSQETPRVTGKFGLGVWNESGQRLTEFCQENTLVIATPSPGGSNGKESACNARDLGSIPGLEGSPGGEHGNPVWYSCLENPMDGRAWWATVHGVTKSWT